jgi:hypothetical protein
MRMPSAFQNPMASATWANTNTSSNPMASSTANTAAMGPVVYATTLSAGKAERCLRMAE